MRALHRTMLVILAVVAGGAGAASALAADSTFTASATRAAVFIPSSTPFNGGGGLLGIGAGGRSKVGKVALRVTCHAPDGLPCTIGVAVASGRHIVAKARKVLGGTTKLYLRLNGYARAKLQRHGLVLVTLAVAHDHHGHTAVAGFKGTLRQIVVRRP